MRCARILYAPGMVTHLSRSVLRTVVNLLRESSYRVAGMLLLLLLLLLLKGPLVWRQGVSHLLGLGLVALFSIRVLSCIIIVGRCLRIVEVPWSCGVKVVAVWSRLVVWCCIPESWRAKLGVLVIVVVVVRMISRVRHSRRLVLMYRSSHSVRLLVELWLHVLSLLLVEISFWEILLNSVTLLVVATLHVRLLVEPTLLFVVLSLWTVVWSRGLRICLDGFRSLVRVLVVVNSATSAVLNSRILSSTLISRLLLLLKLRVVRIEGRGWVVHLWSCSCLIVHRRERAAVTIGHSILRMHRWRCISVRWVHDCLVAYRSAYRFCALHRKGLLHRRGCRLRVCASLGVAVSGGQIL
mmetsp:Transcript_14485/g.26046  ORF Transcript_14485/g.26046 Transcript_14485/m.26046 type:complete len:353 (+) Transcript_14485:541-1599(+)